MVSLQSKIIGYRVCDLTDASISFLVRIVFQRYISLYTMSDQPYLHFSFCFGCSGSHDIPITTPRKCLCVNISFVLLQVITMPLIDVLCWHTRALPGPLPLPLSTCPSESLSHLTPSPAPCYLGTSSSQAAQLWHQRGLQHPSPSLLGLSNTLKNRYACIKVCVFSIYRADPVSPGQFLGSHLCVCVCVWQGKDLYENFTHFVHNLACISIRKFIIVLSLWFL